MKYLIGFFVIAYLLMLFFSFKGWGHVGYNQDSGVDFDGITYVHLDKSVRKGSVGGVGGRSSGRGGK